MKTALLSGMLALAAAFPANVLYYGTRKAIRLPLSWIDYGKLRAVSSTQVLSWLY